MSDKMPTMLTINETAARSGLARHYLRQLCVQGRICYVKAGSKYLINFERLVEFLNTGESVEHEYPTTGTIREL